MQVHFRNPIALVMFVTINYVLYGKMGKFTSRSSNINFHFLAKCIDLPVLARVRAVPAVC